MEGEGREQDSGKTERERECVRGERERASAIKWTVREKHMETQMEQNVRLISEMIKNVANDVVPMIRIFSLLVSKRHLDLWPVLQTYFDDRK
jgi:hypothetical protein